MVAKATLLNEVSLNEHISLNIISLNEYISLNIISFNMFSKNEDNSLNEYIFL